MRWLSSILLLLTLSPIATGTEKFPYTAYVNADEAYVRSGPGKNYYPTMKLARGDEVEVYRHDPGGWCAIRPPRRSFSWVPSSALKIDRDGIATVLPEQLPTRVGSAFGEMRDTTQVRLDRGELVDVMESHVLGDGAERQEWSMIAPPSGEFRWISVKLIDRNPPEAGDDNPEHVPRRVQTEVARSRRPATEPPSEQFDVRQTAGTEEVRENDRNWRGREPSRDQDREATSQPPRAKTSRGKKNPLTPDEAFQADLDEIDLELSVVVAEEPNSWRFDDLQRRTEAIADRSSTAVQRGRAREMLNKLARFDEIKRRYDLANSTGPLSRGVNRTASAEGSRLTAPLPPIGSSRQLTDPFGSSPATVASPPPPPPIASSTVANAAITDSRFDGRGKLTKVVSQRPGAPHYALVDGSGQVTAFVTQGPGVNMEPYVGREVGITGERGYMPEFKKTHVTALRVSLADATTIR